MPPKRLRQQQQPNQQSNKTVTIYNSNKSGGKTNAKEKHKNVVCSYEQNRNSLENWEFHFKPNEIENVKTTTKLKDLNGVPLLIGAAVLNQKDIFVNLLKHGYNINEADKNNLTPLAWAVKVKNLELIHLLLIRKANANIKPNKGDHIVFLALGSNAWDEKSFLLFWNDLRVIEEIDANATNRNGLSMLHLAVRRDWILFVEILTTNDININATNANGVTPLMLASYRNDYEIVTRLIDKGANVKRRNSDGFTALCYAFSAAIMKHLNAPYLIIDKLKCEMAKNKIYINDYLKDRLKMIAQHRLKKACNDQPTTEQMLQHIIKFVICHLDDGFHILWKDLLVVDVIKEALEKYLNEKDHIKLPLILLNTLMKSLWYCKCIDEEEEELIIDQLIESGCFDVCIKILTEYHNDDDETIGFLAFTSIICTNPCTKTFKKWLENYGDVFNQYFERTNEIINKIDQNEVEMMQSHINKFKQYFNPNLKITKLPIKIEESKAQPQQEEQEIETKALSKKSKRRAKAMKAKLAKMQVTDLAESCRTHSETIDEESTPKKEVTKSNSEESVCVVNAIKTALGILEEDDDDDDTIINEEKPQHKDDWKTIIHQLPFHKCPNLKLYKPSSCTMHLNKCNKKCKYIDIDLAIKYLEGLLAMIVNKYKMIWEMDKVYDDVTENLITKIDSEEENVEKDKLRLIHREFYNLTRNIRTLYDNNVEHSHYLLKELEKLLLTHPIRDNDRIMEQVTATEVIKVNVSMPCDFGEMLPKYMERVLNAECDELSNVEIKIVEHVSGAQKGMDHNCMGDYVYMNELCDCNTGINHNLDYYHLASTILNICDDGDDVMLMAQKKSCCNKGCLVHGHNKNEADEDEDDDDDDDEDEDEDEDDDAKVDTMDVEDSRWCSVLRSLEMMDDAQLFFNGKIRISNVEKRKSHILSPSGNFAALEIALTHENQPLAIKFIPKSDSFTKQLHELIGPLLELKHKNVLHYYMCAYDCKYLVIATPLCEYNLGQYVLKMKYTPMKICKNEIIRQMLSGLMYLHDHDEPIVHGNLKPSNVLIDVHGNVRIAEFGIHKALFKVKNLPESSVIWFATESYKLYKQNGPLECTCASDIQIAGMLVHFAENNGSHPFGKDVIDILKNLEKATPKILCKDMELYDLLAWMLLGEPSERPTIHQVLSHIFFWSNKKKWRYIVACTGLTSKTNIPIDVDKLHASLDKTAYKENISGNCWMLTAKKKYPQAAFIENNDTPSGLLKFIKFVIENQLILQADEVDDDNDGDGEKEKLSLKCFILNSFPYFPLSLYRMIENTEWSDHRVFMPFHNVIDY